MFWQITSSDSITAVKLCGCLVYSIDKLKYHQRHGSMALRIKSDKYIFQCSLWNEVCTSWFLLHCNRKCTATQWKAKTAGTHLQFWAMSPMGFYVLHTANMAHDKGWLNKWYIGGQQISQTIKNLLGTFNIRKYWLKHAVNRLSFPYHETWLSYGIYDKYFVLKLSK